MAQRTPRAAQWTQNGYFQMKISHPAALVVLTLLGHDAWAQASGTALATDPNWSITAETGRVSYRAHETGAAGQTLNSEAGHLQQEKLGLGYQVNARWKLTATAESMHDTVGYDGLTQNSIPLQTQTHIRINRYEGRAQYTWIQESAYQILVAAGLEHLSLDRAIRGTLPAPPLLPFGTQPLTETLHTTRAIVGGALNWSLLPALPGATLQLKAELMPSLAHRLDVNTFGTYDNKQVRPRASLDWRLGFDFQYRLTPNLKFTLAKDTESLSPRASSTEVLTKNGSPVATVMYPGSKQYLRSTRLGLAWEF
jgi:hypothetical protein